MSHNGSSWTLFVEGAASVSKVIRFCVRWTEPWPFFCVFSSRDASPVKNYDRVNTIVKRLNTQQQTSSLLKCSLPILNDTLDISLPVQLLLRTSEVEI